jgi:hypothetical protein
MGMPANPAASAVSEPSGAGASPAPSGPSATPTPAPPAGNSSDGGSLPSAADSAGIKSLREAYENLKKEHEPYSKLGKVDEISSHVSIAQKITSQALELGKTLGYDEADIRNGLAADPEGTLLFLRQAASAVPNDPNKALEQLLEKRLKPIEERISKEDQVKASTEAQTRFNTAFDEGIKTLFKDESVPGEEQDLIYEATLALLKRDGEAMKRLYEGKTSDVLKYMTHARETFDKYYLARSQRESKPGDPKKDGKTVPETKLDLNDLGNGIFPKTGPLSKYA